MADSISANGDFLQANQRLLMTAALAWRHAWHGSLRPGLRRSSSVPAARPRAGGSQMRVRGRGHVSGAAVRWRGSTDPRERGQRHADNTSLRRGRAAGMRAAPALAAAAALAAGDDLHPHDGRRSPQSSRLGPARADRPHARAAPMARRLDLRRPSRWPAALALHQRRAGGSGNRGRRTAWRFTGEPRVELNRARLSPPRPCLQARGPASGGSARR